MVSVFDRGKGREKVVTVAAAAAIVVVTAVAAAAFPRAVYFIFM